MKTRTSNEHRIETRSGNVTLIHVGNNTVEIWTGTQGKELDIRIALYGKELEPIKITKYSHTFDKEIDE